MHLPCLHHEVAGLKLEPALEGRSQTEVGDTVSRHSHSQTGCSHIQRCLQCQTIQHRTDQHVLLSWLPTVKFQAEPVSLQELCLHFRADFVWTLCVVCETTHKQCLQLARVLQRGNDHHYVLHNGGLHWNWRDQIHH